MKLLFISLSLIHLSCAILRPKDEGCMSPVEYHSKSSQQIFADAVKIVERPSEKKAVAFCVFGSKKLYTHGVLENIDLAKKFYPGWDVVIFFDSETVPKDIIEQAKQKGAITKVSPEFNHASARFYVADMDYDRFISRDADSRIYPREVAAVADWMKNDWAILHNMRDEAGHSNPMLAGMWGAQVKPLRKRLKKFDHQSNMEKLYKAYIGNRKEVFGDDENFLRDKILKAVGVDHFLTHESVRCDAFPHSRGFPIPRNDEEHIGSKVVL